MTLRPRKKKFAIESCCDATQLTSVASKIPLENAKLHFPLIFQSIDYKLRKYINLYFPKQWAAFWRIIQFLYTHRATNGITYICPWYSHHAPPLLYFIISYVDAPCLWNIK